MMGFQPLFEIFLIGLVIASGEAADSATTFDVTMDKVDNSVSKIYIGQTDIVNVTITLPDGDRTTPGVVVRFIASLSETVFAFSRITEVSQSSDVSMSNPNWQDDIVLIPGPEYTDPNLKIVYNTKATFDLGNVTSNGTGGSSYITIQCEMVHVSLGSYSTGVKYRPAAALTNSAASTVSVSREEYTLEGATNPSHTNEASFELSPLPEFEDGGKIVTTDLTMNISHGQAALNVEAYVLNETQSISPVKMEMTSVGGAYNYSFRPEKMQATRFEECFVKNTTQQLLALDIGTVVNRESQKSTPDVSQNLIVLRISWLVFSTEALGKTYDLSVAVDVNGQQLYVTTVEVNVTARNPPANPLTNVTAASVGPNVISAGTACSVGVVMDTPEGSLHTYNVTLTTRQVNANESKLMLVSYTSGDNGDNLPCPPEEIQALTLSKTDPSNPKVTNEGNITLAVLNTGLMSTNEQPFTVKMLAMPDAINNSVHELVVDINGVQTAVEFTILNNTFDVNFTASSSDNGEMLAGGFGSVKVTIHTRPETAYIYNMNLQTRIKNGVESQLSIVNYKLAASGETTPYVLEGLATLTLAKTDATNPYVNNIGNMTTFTLVNTGLVSSNNLEFDVKLVASVDAINGTVYEVVVDINGVQKIVEITVGLQKQLNTTFTATFLETSVIEAWGLGKALVTIETTPESLQQFDVKLAVQEKNGTSSDLVFREHSLVSGGQTAPIILEGPEVLTLSESQHLKNESNINFTALNDGMMTTNETAINVHLLALPNAVNNTVYELVVGINGVIEVVEFTIGEGVSLNTSVAYNVTMNVTSSSRLTPGDTFTLKATVNTIPDTVPGAMTIVLPEPLVPNNTPYVEFIEAETTSKGANVLFPLSGPLDFTMSSWNGGLGDGKKAAITVPFVRNIQTATDDAENDWVIEFKFRLMNHTDLHTAEQQVTFGVTMHFTDNQFYDGTVAITSDPGSLASSTNQRSQTVHGAALQPDDSSEPPYWWIGVGIGIAICLAAIAIAVILAKKKRDRKKSNVVTVKEKVDVVTVNENEAEEVKSD